MKNPIAGFASQYAPFPETVKDDVITDSAEYAADATTPEMRPLEGTSP